jgi:predicted permease
MAAELAEEMELHRALMQRELEEGGLDEKEAAYATRRAFGNETVAREAARAVWLWPWLQSVAQDMTYAARGLRRDPFLALTATLTLAVCIGANTAVFSLANAVLIRPLPYPDSHQIDWISERSGPRQEDVGVAPDYFYLRQQNRIFEDVAAFVPATVNWTGVETPEQLNAAFVSPSFFQVLGMQPLSGRYLAQDEQGRVAPDVAVISYAFWRNQLAGDEHAVGKTIALDRQPRTIIGVMPQAFDFPRGAQMWLPASLDESAHSFPVSPERPILTVSMLARRKAGLTSEQVQADIDRLTTAIRSQYKVFQSTGFRSDLSIAAVPLQRHLTGDTRPALLILSAAAGLVLLVACVNLASLLLARASSRRRELAVRLALGSGRGRVVRQLLTECLVMALPGGAAGIGLAWVAVDLLNAAKPEVLAAYPAIAMDLTVLAFSIALTVATSLVFGLTPAFSAAGIRIQEAMRSGLAQSSGPATARLRKALVVAELALSLVLLIGAGLLARSLFHLSRTELGFDSGQLLTFRINPIGPFDRDHTVFYGEVLDRLERIPFVSSAALVSDMPLNDEDFYQTGRIRVDGPPAIAFAERPIINNSLVSPDFLRTLRVPLKAGRFFDVYDAGPSREAAPGFVAAEPVVVNESFVKRMFPGENPLGRRLVFGPDERNILWTIIGVAGDVRGGSLGADPPSMVYRCTCSGSRVFRAGFIVRTQGEPTNAAGTVAKQVRAVDADQPIFDVRTMDERRDAALAPGRFALVLACAFAIIAMLLAAAGIYGVMSYLVTLRTREIGIRVAIGARPVNILSMVTRETAMLAVIAVALGLASGWALSRYIRSMLHGVSELDPLTFLLTPVLLVLIVLIASLGPSLRAVRLDPMTALREE